MLCADVVEVMWRDRGGRRNTAMGLLEDISHSGACLQLETPAPIGARIRWHAAGHEYAGHVRYCVYREIGYFVGVEFAADYKWSKEEFEPEHLLDLKKLVE